MSGIWEDNSPKKTLDLNTGVVYPSRHQAGKAIAIQAGIDPDAKPSPWCKVVREFPQRFVDVKSGKMIDRNGRTTV
jgi:hypothetical protein